MGAALTYARRYALFTLVGIAGEDDLDAPDLHDVDVGSPGPTNGTGHVAVGQQGVPPPRSSGNGHARGAAKGNVVVLAPDQSAALRDRLLGEVASITEADTAAAWARGVLAAKNSLTAADAKLVEDAFEQRIARLVEPVVAEEPAVPTPAANQPAAMMPAAMADVTEADQPSGIDKSLLVIAEPRRYRNREHLRFVAAKPCLICGRKPSDPHHLRFTQPRALGRKVSDEFVVPLCRGHHREAHRSGNERAWWKAAGVEPLKAARKLWRQTRLDGAQGRQEVGLTAQPNTRHRAPMPGLEGPPADQVVAGPAKGGRPS
jgi:hypothetical protein